MWKVRLASMPASLRPSRSPTSRTRFSCSSSSLAFARTAIPSTAYSRHRQRYQLREAESFDLLDDVLAGRVRACGRDPKDRLSQYRYKNGYYLFQKYNCEIVVMSVRSEKLDSQEIFEEIVNLLYCYSMKLYRSRRRLRKVIEAIEDDEAGRNTTGLNLLHRSTPCCANSVIVPRTCTTTATT